MKIVLIEDNLDYSKRLIRDLLSRGHDVLHATDFYEAKKVIREHLDADLFIMDYNLGLGRDGSDVTRIIRHEQKKRGLKPSAIIGNSGDDDFNEKLREAGADDSMEKGSAERILQALEDLIMLERIGLKDE